MFSLQAQLLKNRKINKFNSFQKQKNIICSEYMIFFIVFLDKTRVLTRKSCRF